MKTNNVVTVFNLLNSAKINEVGTSGKIKIIKAVREMKPIATGFDELLNDAREKLQGENHNEMAEKAMRWQQQGDDVDLTDEEKIAVNTYFMEYGNRIDECVKLGFKNIILPKGNQRSLQKEERVKLLYADNVFTALSFAFAKKEQ